MSIGAVLFTLALSMAMFAGMLFNYDPDFRVESSFTWINLGDFNIQLGFLVDNITITMLLVVALISSMSHIFSIKYMEGDPLYSRYYAYLSLFTFSMNGIVLSNNLMLLYMSWELVGLSSYLLIGFWFAKKSAADAGMKAFLTNRVGDIGFFIGIMLLFTAVGSVVYSDIFTSVADGNLAGTLLTMAGIGLFIGAMGKSSQFPLHIWLPDAMEGPTPVSALMHAATMVAAGVFMMVRLFPIMTPDALVFVAYIGGFTALFAATIAITQNDIKKVLAYSTVSQLGFMIMSVGTGAYVAAFFHLVTHAAFKANLFYGSGSVIYAMHHALHKKNDHETDPQDMRNMGGLASKMPVTATAMMLGSMSIIGIPLIGGFWSKEVIIGKTWYAYFHGADALLGPALLILATAGMTGFYMSRMWFMTFAGEPRNELVEHVHEATPWIKTPLVVLSIMTALGGFGLAVYGAVEFLSAEADYLSLHGHTLLEQIIHEVEHAFLPEDMQLRYVGWVTILLAFIIGPIMAARIYGGALKEGEQAIPLVHWLTSLSGKFGSQNVDDLANSELAEALQQRLYFDDLYEGILARTIVPFAAFAAWFDANVIDGAIKQIESKSVLGSVQIRRVTTGSARDYILMAAIGALSIFALIWGVNA